MIEVLTAQALLSKHWNGVSLSVNPATIATAEGLHVLEVTMQKGVGGEYLGRTVEGVYVMRINRHETSIRKRFAIAHALGHHVLGHGRCPCDSAEHYSFGNVHLEPKEREANRFALELLIPEVVVRRLVFENGISDVTRLAFVMKVSDVVMKHRLTHLDL